MPIFSNDDLNQIFPEASPETYVNPTDARYEQIAGEYTKRTETIGRLAITGGDEDIIGDLIESPIELEKFDIDKLPLDAKFRKRIAKSILDIKKLAIDLFPTNNLNSTETLDDQLAKINWPNLQEAYYEYNLLELGPELLISYEGNTPEFWETLFNTIRQEQLENHDKTTPYHGILKSTFQLNIDPGIRDVWNNSIVKQNPEWKISIISGYDSPIRTKISHKGTDIFRKFSKYLQCVSDIQYLVNNNRMLVHPTIESYLTLQALKLMNGRPPVDSKFYSWLDGVYEVSNNTYSPIGTWKSYERGIEINKMQPEIRDYHIGVRPIVGQTT